MKTEIIHGIIQSHVNVGRKVWFQLLVPELFVRVDSFGSQVDKKTF